jgi:hypothetical protein
MPIHIQPRWHGNSLTYGIAAFAALWAGWYVVALYILAPFKIRQNQRKPARTYYTACEITELPPHVSSYFLTNAPTLASCGFTTLGSATHKNPESGQESYVSLWVNQKTKDTVQIITVVTPSATGQTKIASLVTFRTEHADDSAIVTSNTKSSGIFPKDPKVSSIRVAGLSDLSELYRLHRARISRDNTSRRPTLTKFVDTASRIQLEHTETFERLIEAGYYVFDAAADEYIPTIRGAFLMTYRLLPPFRQIQRMRKNRAAVKEMREVGFELPVTMQQQISA